MRWSWLRLALPLLSLVSAVYSKSSAGSSVLVVLEPQLAREDYSLFFSGLEGSGYELTFRSPKDESPLAIKDDVPQFSHVIVFAPSSKSFAPDLLPQSLVHLLSKNVNLILALSQNQNPITSLAGEFSLTLPPPHTPLISHFPERDYPATIIPIHPPKNPASPILSSKLNPVLFSGVPHILGTNPLLVPILRAPEESFASESVDDTGAASVVDAAEKGGEGLWAGSQLGVVTGFQAQRDTTGRAVIVGGVEVFSDDYANREVSKGVKSGNLQFGREVAAWAFQETLVLRIEETSHHRVNETEPPEVYTTKDQIVYSIRVSRFNHEAGVWAPYSGLKDFQMEFTMLDPHIRAPLKPVPGKAGLYAVTFTAPDRHGVFKFVIDHKRKGWTHLQHSTVVSVVPPRHDGYPRFLSAAWPYYVGAISTSVGFVLFSALWLGGDVAEKSGKKAKGSKTD